MRKKFASLKSLKKGLGSGSISQRYWSAALDPDPHQNVTDLQHDYLNLFRSNDIFVCCIRYGRRSSVPETQILARLSEDSPPQSPPLLRPPAAATPPRPTPPPPASPYTAGKSNNTTSLPAVSVRLHSTNSLPRCVWKLNGTDDRTWYQAYGTCEISH